MRTHLDLFSGIGGFALAARWAGVETIGFAEIDDYASRVLSKNFPGVANYGDVRNVPGELSAWLITGGFPCQPFSVAGKQRGKADDRWLWPEMAGVIECIRPRWVLGENVPGIIRMELDTVLSDLERLDYTAWPIVIPAVGVDAPHRRERVWIVANANSGRFEQRHTQKRTISESYQNGADVSNSNRTGLAQRESVAGNDGTQQPPVVGGCRWQSEPGMGRTLDGLSAKLDGGRLDEQGSSEEGSTAAHNGREMSGVWVNKQSATSSPGHHETARRDCFMPEMPHGNTQIARNMGNWQQKDSYLCDMRQSVCITGLASAQDMQHKMLEYTRAIERQQAMGQWDAEPDIPRIATGVKNRVDRLRGLGNAIVPQVAYQLIRMMIAADEVAEVTL